MTKAIKDKKIKGSYLNNEAGKERIKYVEFLESEVLRLRTENKELKAQVQRWEKEAEIWEKRFDEVFKDWRKALIKSEDVIVVGKGALVRNWKG